MNTNWSLTDTHIHLDQYSPEELKFLLKICHEQGIRRFIVPDVSFNLKNWELPVSADIYCCWGCHPQWSNAPWSPCGSVVAVGECGLDSRCDCDKKLQHERFLSQLTEAQSRNLPVLIHCVKSYGKVLDLIKEANFLGSGVVHGFSSSVEIAKKFMEKGFALGIGALLLDERAHRIRDAVVYAGSQHIVLETDAPFFRGTTPLSLIDIAQTCSTILKCSLERLSENTEDTVNRIFKIGTHNYD